MSDDRDEEREFQEEADLTEKLETFMEEHNDEFLKDDRIAVGRRMSSRPDINAFMILNRLFPGDRDIVCAAEHDEIFLDVDPHELMQTASEEDLVDLIRCGVFYDSSHDSLAMFV